MVAIDRGDRAMIARLRVAQQHGVERRSNAMVVAQVWRDRLGRQVGLERAPEFGEVGAGLAITGNGMTALGAIGAADAVRDAGYQTSTAGYQGPDGRRLMQIPDVPSLRKVTTIWGVHRQRLHAAVLEAAKTADGIELINGAEVTEVRPGQVRGESARVTWRTGVEARRQASALVVAADGVRSTVRAMLFPGAPARYSGSTCWRAVIPD